MAQKVTINGFDQSAYVQYGSMTVKLNTCDFTLVDGLSLATIPLSIVIKDPGWTGTAVRLMYHDIVDRQTTRYYATLGATNTDAVVARPTPFNLSDNPSAAAVSHFLLEDGSGALVLEDGSAWAPGDYALESSTDSYGYRNLSVDKQINSADQSTSTKVTATIFQPGLWPGMSLKVVSVNIPNHASGGQTYVVSQVTTTWTAGTPTFTVEMTAAVTEHLPTLSLWRLSG